MRASLHGRLFLPALALWLLWLTGPGIGQAADLAEPRADIELFTREGCPHCAAAKLFLDDLQQERPDLRIVISDVGMDTVARSRLNALAATRGIRALGVPAFSLGGELIVGYTGAQTTGARIRALLIDRPSSRMGEPAPKGACPAETTEPCRQETAGLAAEIEAVDTPFFGRLTVREVGLPVFTVALGLLDGFNPCSMWVLVFMLSLLAGLRDRLKMVLIAGTFVAVEGLAYFAFMAAWLNVFLVIGLSRATQVVLGGVAGLAGALNVKDFFAFGRGVSLRIPDAAQPGLYARLRAVLQAEHLAGALVGAVALGVLVQIVELACTAGFPALYTQILTLRHLPWWGYYGYLGLYNAAYMLDDVLVLAIGVVTLSQRRLQEREGRWLKLISGAVMLVLGASLIMNPGWLAG